jgi:hypothetical protein
MKHSPLPFPVLSLVAVVEIRYASNSTTKKRDDKKEHQHPHSNTYEIIGINWRHAFRAISGGAGDLVLARRTRVGRQSVVDEFILLTQSKFGFQSLLVKQMKC